MRMIQILLEKSNEGITGTNCGNCKATTDTKTKKASNLNKQGGTIPSNDKELELAKNGDLITMPGTEQATIMAWCKHPKINQWVTKRMCCAYWDAPGTLRTYGKQTIGQNKE